MGDAIGASGLPREAIFVIAKIGNPNIALDKIERSVAASVAALARVPDVMPLHWPVPEPRQGTWSALKRMARAGDLCAIGVSNFMAAHLRELLSGAGMVPAVNQTEVTPFLHQRSVRDLCAAGGVAVSACSPPTKGRRLDHPL